MMMTNRTIEFVKSNTDTDNKAVRPYNGLEKLESLFRRHIGLEFKYHDQEPKVKWGTQGFSMEQAKFEGGTFSVLFGNEKRGGHSTFLNELPEAAREAGLEPEDLRILISIRFGMLGVSEVVFSRKGSNLHADLIEGDSGGHETPINSRITIIDKSEIRPFPARAIDEEMVISVIAVLDSDLKNNQSKGYAYFPYTWLARNDYRVSRPNPNTSFEPYPLTEKVREDNDLDENCLDYVLIDFDPTDKNQSLEGEIKYYLDESVLDALVENQESPIANPIVWNIASTIHTNIFFVSSKILQGKEVSYADIKGSELGQVIGAMAESDLERQEILSLTIHEPHKAIAKWQSTRGEDFIREFRIELEREE